MIQYYLFFAFVAITMTVAVTGALLYKMQLDDDKKEQERLAEESEKQELERLERKKAAEVELCWLQDEFNVGRDALFKLCKAKDKKLRELVDIWNLELNTGELSKPDEELEE